MFVFGSMSHPETTFQVYKQFDLTVKRTRSPGQKSRALTISPRIQLLSCTFRLALCSLPFELNNSSVPVSEGTLKLIRRVENIA